MKLKPRTPMTALDACVCGRLGAVSMQPSSDDKRFRRQLAERDVAVEGLTDGERGHWRGPIMAAEGFGGEKTKTQGAES